MTLPKSDLPLLMTLFLLVIALILIGLSIPPALRSKLRKRSFSWRRFFLSLALVATGILIPLYIFVLSMLLTPSWKGECDHGWLDCFHSGKIALTPLVLWACAAFYVAQILKPDSKRRAWVDLGIFVGASVSGICFIIGLVIHDLKDEGSLWLIVPFWVAVWYSALSIRAISASRPSPIDYLITILLSAPFWIIGVLGSKKHYLSLPEEPPDCFVVTAALRGHESLVGPFATIKRHGASRVANRQLRTFWQFERLWASKSPRTHRSFRCFYNRFGPQLAARIKSKFVADLAYIFLKPFEAIAALLIYASHRSHRLLRQDERELLP